MGDPAAAAILTTAISGASTAVANAIANAIKASGAIIKVEPEDFQRILSRTSDPVVVMCPTGFKLRKAKYLVAWRGFVFYCIAHGRLNLTGCSEVIAAKKIWVPN